MGHRGGLPYKLAASVLAVSTFVVFVTVALIVAVVIRLSLDQPDKGSSSQTRIQPPTSAAQASAVAPELQPTEHLDPSALITDQLLPGPTESPSPTKPSAIPPPPSNSTPRGTSTPAPLPTAAFIASPLPSIAATQPAEPVSIPPPQQPAPGQIVIQFQQGTTAQQREAYVQSFGGTVDQDIGALNTVVVSVPAHAAEQRLPESSIVMNSEPDYYVTALDGPLTGPCNDPLYPQQWALPAIGVPEAWAALPDNAPTVLVAVIDSGVCADHPDLAGRIEPGWDFVDGDTVPQDDFGHGCGVTGIIAANINDGLGMAGVAPNAQVMPLRVLDSGGIGTYSDVAAAIVYATDHGAQIINLSLGGYNPSGLLEEAVNYADARDVTIIAAAGNTGQEGVLYPAKYEPVIAVGSVDQSLELSNFSTYGPEIDLLAPGRDILTTQRDGSYGLVSGTSFAAPYGTSAVLVLRVIGQELVLGGNALSLQGSTQPYPTATPHETIRFIPTSALSTLPPAIIPTLEVETFVHPDQGYRVRIPTSWVIELSAMPGRYTQYPQLRLSSVPFAGNSENGIERPGGASYIYIAFESNQLRQGQSLQEYVELFIASPIFMPSGNKRSFGDLVALELSSDFSQVYVFAYGKNVYSVTVPKTNNPDHDSLIADILASIEFTQPNPLESHENPFRHGVTSRLPRPQTGVAGLAFPNLRLPWDRSSSYKYSGGPHRYGDTNYKQCNPYALNSLSGIDFGLPTGTEVLASGSGTVSSGWAQGGIGWYVDIEHADGWRTEYWHLSAINDWVSSNTGQMVQQGQVIGYSGGNPQHLHLELMHYDSRASWHDVTLDGYRVRSIVDATNETRGLNYQGTLTVGMETLAASGDYRCVEVTRLGRRWSGSTQTIGAGASQPLVRSTNRRSGKAGDANGDERIDGVDYTIWLNHYLETTTRGPADGDFDNNGRVDGVDYTIWLLNYGT